MAIQSTKQLVEISNIVDNIVLLKNGSLRSVIEVSAINFELRSEGEQIAILQNFQRFVNSIDFPLQIVVNSRKLNIEEYLKLIDESSNALTNELLKIQAAEYSKFIKELSDLSNIMSKKFYIVVPFYVFEAPSKSGIAQSIKSICKPSAVVKELTPEQLETYKSQLLQRTELIFDGLVGMGLKTRTLEKDDLMNLFYGLYNPSSKSDFVNLGDKTLDLK
jgi:type IV secretory pathway VirB4 component